MNEVARRMAIKPLTAVLVRPKRMSDLPALHRRANISAGDPGGFSQRGLLSIFNMLGLAEDVLTLDPGDRGDHCAALPVCVDVQRHVRAPARDRHDARPGGASGRPILAIVLLESLRVARVGGLAGILGGHGVAYLGAHLLAVGRAGPPILLPSSALQPSVLGGVVLSARWPACCPRCSPIAPRSRENLAPLLLSDAARARPCSSARRGADRICPSSRRAGPGGAAADVRPAGRLDPRQLRA